MMLEDATAIASVQHQMASALHEYNTAYGFTPDGIEPAQREEVHHHGLVVIDLLGGNMPPYEVAMADLASLAGEQHVHDLITTANTLQSRFESAPAGSKSPGM